jgi:ATP synthase protein I
MPQSEPPREEALKRLDARADALEARTVRPTADYGANAVGQAYGLLGVLLGGPGLGLALGWAVDAFAGTAPWGIIGGVLLGFAVSIYMALGSARRLSARASQVPPQPAVPFDDEDEDQER